MAVEIELSQSAGHLRATLWGRVALAESREVMRQVVAATEKAKASLIMLDIQAADCKLSYADTVALVADLDAWRQKIAVLYREDRQEDIAQFLELCAGRRGYRIRAFTDCDEAMQWLGSAVTREAS